MSIVDTMNLVIKLAKDGMWVELQEKIMELRLQVLEQQEENIALRNDNLELRKELEKYTKGDICPKCKQPAWTLESSTAKPGAKLLRVFRCLQCGFSEQYLQDALIK